jgi:2-dehydropantoate 2-reductase
VAERILVVGAGAIGGFAGARLARASHPVTLVDVDAGHVEAIRQRGLRVSGMDDFTVRVPCLYPDEVQGPFAIVLLAVKGHHTEEALRQLAHCLAPDGCVVSLQNGLQEYKIARLVGPERTVGAFLPFGGHYRAPGEVVYGGPGSFRVGEIDGRVTDRIRRLADLLSAVHPVEVTDNIFGWLWGKLVIGCIYEATALADADVVDILDRPEALALLADLGAETERVAEAKGVRTETIDGFDPQALLTPRRLSPELWDAQRRYWRSHLSRRTGVWRDLAIRHRPTEVDSGVGEVIGRGREVGVPTPLCQRLYDLTKAAERGEVPLGWDTFFAIRG